MRIVVIGGTGLIGSKLVEKLREDGHDPLAASPDTGVNTLTGEGLAEALEGAEVVVDVANAPAWEDDAVMEFFQTSSSNVLAAETAAGVGHHVALSVVGADRLAESGYMRAKVAQEEAIKAGGVPYTILRATQFFEFIGRIADSSVDGETIHLAPVLVQPEAADDVAAALADVAVSEPVNGTVELRRPGAVPARRARPARPPREQRSPRGDGRRPRALLRRRARRALTHPRRQPPHRTDPFRGLAHPVPDPEEALMRPRPHGGPDPGGGGVCPWLPDQHHNSQGS